MTRADVLAEYRYGNTNGKTFEAVDQMADEIVRLRDAVATVSGERDALAAVVEVLRRYYMMQADDDQLYDAFCAWRENPFTNPTRPHA